MAGVALAGFFRSWLHEDAFITFRVVDNALAGYGLVWNPDERVQVYTHPLWMLSLVPLRAMAAMLGGGDEVFFGLVSCWSILCAAIGVGIIAHAAVGRPGVWLTGLIIPLAASDSIRSYVSSGFENALAFPLVAAFIVLAIRRWENPPWFSLFLIFSLSILNRMDTVLLLAPMLATLLWRHRVWRGWRGAAVKIIAGSMPVVAWSGFCLIYYGFVFPTPRYAKLDPSLPRGDYIAHGMQYALELVRSDPASVGLVLAALLVPLLVIGRPVRTWGGGVAASLGVGLYCAYTVWVGGDYNAGRFWSTPSFAALALIVASAKRDGEGMVGRYLSPLAAGLVCLGLVVDVSGAARAMLAKPINVAHHWDDYPRGMPFDGQKTQMVRSYWLHQVGEDLARSAATQGGRVTKIFPAIGIAAFAAGPGAIILDPLGLGDALMARLPSAEGRLLLVGHIRRQTPPGYFLARSGGDRSRMHPALADYERRLSMVIRGPVWSVDRFWEILRFQAGLNDGLLQRYVADAAPDRPHVLEALAPDMPDDSLWFEPEAVLLPVDGRPVRFDAAAPLRAERIIFGGSAYATFRLTFHRLDKVVGVLVVPQAGAGQALRHRALAVPDTARAAGFDRVDVQGIAVDDDSGRATVRYFVGQMAFEGQGDGEGPPVP